MEGLIENIHSLEHFIYMYKIRIGIASGTFVQGMSSIVVRSLFFGAFGNLMVCLVDNSSFGLYF